MQITSDLTPQEAYKKLKMKYAVQGLVLAWVSAITAILQGNINTMVNSGLNLGIKRAAFIVVIISVAILAMGDFIGGIWLLLYNVAHGRSVKEYFRVGKTKVGLMMLLASFFGGPISTGCWMSASNFCGLTYTLIITSLSPILTALFGRIVLKEHLSSRSIFGIIIAVVGIALATFSPPTGDKYPHFYLGILLAACAPVGFTLEGMLSTYASDIIDPMVGCSLYRSMGSGIMGLILALFIGFGTGNGTLAFNVIGTIAKSPSAFMWILLAALCAGTTYVTTYIAFNKCGPTRTLAVVNTMPAWSIPIGFAFAAVGLMDYSVTPIAIVGALVVIIGITMVVAKPSELLNLRDV